MIHDSKRRYHTLPKRNDTNFKNSRINPEIEPAFSKNKIKLTEVELTILSELCKLYTKESYVMSSVFNYIKTLIIFNQSASILNPITEKYGVTKIPPFIIMKFKEVKSMLNSAKSCFSDLFFPEIFEDFYSKLLELRIIEVDDNGLILPGSRIFSIRTYDELYSQTPRSNVAKIFDPES